MLKAAQMRISFDMCSNLVYLYRYDEIDQNMLMSPYSKSGLWIVCVAMEANPPRRRPGDDSSGDEGVSHSY
jgi:hypothetical protein